MQRSLQSLAQSKLKIFAAHKSIYNLCSLPSKLLETGQQRKRAPFSLKECSLDFVSNLIVAQGRTISVGMDPVTKYYSYVALSNGHSIPFVRLVILTNFTNASG